LAESGDCLGLEIGDWSWADGAEGGSGGGADIPVDHMTCRSALAREDVGKFNAVFT